MAQLGSSLKGIDHYNLYVDGVFDLPHEGHLSFIKKSYRLGVKRAAHDRARYGGVRILVGVCDEGVRAYKREPIMTLQERAESLQNLIGDSLPAEVLTVGVPIQVTPDFVLAHDIRLVLHGDDYDQKMLDKYYGSIRGVAAFSTVPYSGCMSTSEILRTAKEEGFYAADSTHLAVVRSALINRIRARSWDQLNLMSANMGQTRDIEHRRGSGSA